MHSSQLRAPQLGDGSGGPQALWTVLNCTYVAEPQAPVIVCTLSEPCAMDVATLLGISIVGKMNNDELDE